MKIYLVGGAVRDQLLNLPIKERDWVVVGGTVAEMVAQGYKQVGKDFPVFLHPKTKEEYALARMERKVRPGYTGFTFDTSKTVTLEEDLARRDITINAIAMTEAGELIDPFHGLADINAKVLRHVSAAFSEDPVRILRVGRFLARFSSLGFTVAKETIDLMQTMVKQGEVNALVPERVYKELERSLQEPHPEKFFEVLDLAHALPILFPELNMGGNGMKALSASTAITTDPMIRFAVLFHDAAEIKVTLASFHKRFRLPNQYRVLTELTASYHQKALHLDQQTPQSLLDLFYILDIFRKPKRFEQFLIACEVIAKTQNKTFEKDALNAYAMAAKNVDVSKLISQGFRETALGNEIKKARLNAIKALFLHRLG